MRPVQLPEDPTSVVACDRALQGWAQYRALLRKARRPFERQTDRDERLLTIERCSWRIDVLLARRLELVDAEVREAAGYLSEGVA